MRSYDDWKLRSDRDEMPDVDGDRPEPDQEDEMDEPARCWSVSKQRWLPLSEMNHTHLVNAHQRFLAGHYQVPVDDADPLVLRPLSGAEHALLLSAFESEIQRRMAQGGKP